MDGNGFTLAIAILVHRDPEQFQLLVETLRHPSVRLYVHLDAKADADAFAQRTNAPGLVWLERRSICWGGIELVDAELDALRQAVADGCDYFVIISGQDFPVRPVSELVRFYAANRTRSFVDHSPLPSDRYPLGGRERTDFYTYTLFGRRETYFPRNTLTSPLSARGRALNLALAIVSAPRPRRHFPPYLRPFGGEMWVNLSRDAAQFALDFVAEHPDYRRYHSHTLVPDELFLTSILAGSEFSSDHELVNDDLRFIRWPEPRGNHPAVLTLDDMPALEQSTDMFARKLTMTESRDLIGKLMAQRP